MHDTPFGVVRRSCADTGAVRVGLGRAVALSVPLRERPARRTRLASAISPRGGGSGRVSNGSNRPTRRRSVRRCFPRPRAKSKWRRRQRRQCRGKPPSAAPEGEILPPGGAILPPQTARRLPQELPAEPKAEKPSKPPTEGGLPGLPAEPGQGPLPALPGGGQPKPEIKPKAQPKPKGTAQSPRPSRGPQAANGAGRHEPSHDGGRVVGRAAGAAGHRGLAGRSPGPGAGPLRRRPHTAPTRLPLRRPRRRPTRSRRRPTPRSSRPHAPEAGNAKSAPPTVALNGYCPVELVRNGRWTPGDLRWTVVYDGWIYRLSGPAQRREFQANPEAFTPAYSGNDPVLTVDEHRTVPGQLTYCATYNGRLYVFASAATQLRFNQGSATVRGGEIEETTNERMTHEFACSSRQPSRRFRHPDSVIPGSPSPLFSRRRYRCGRWTRFGCAWRWARWRCTCCCWGP